MMMRASLTIGALLSVIFFPWKFAAGIAIAAAVMEPLVPLAVGMLADILYYVPQTHTVPLFTVYGAIATACAFVLRNWVRTGIIGG